MTYTARRRALTVTKSRAALVAALLVVTGACRGDDRRASFPTTTSSSGSTRSTAPPLAPPAPNGCDASALSRARPRADLTSYTVDATLDLAANRVTGTLGARFTPDRDTDKVVLRLWANAPKPAAAGALQDISDVRIDGRPAAVRMQSPTTAVVDSGGLVAGKTIDVTMSFALRLPGPVEDRLSRSGTTVRLGSWLPLLPWEPGVGWALDPPTTSNAEATLSAAANFAVRLDLPDGLEVLGSGAHTEAGHWEIAGAPDWAAVIGNFRYDIGEVDGVDVIVAVERSMNESPAAYLSKVTSSLTELGRRYGPYPYRAFTLALTPGLRGGIEYPGLVMQGPDTNARTTPHEVAHQWFYSLVGNNQARDPWLDEGLSTWAEAQVNNTYTPFRTRQIPSDGRGRLGEPMTYWDAHRGSYYRSVYIQGMQALDALGVSPAAVDCALARYVAANAYRVATPASLLAALKTVAPDAQAVLARYGIQGLS